jgi:hypothetical protein
VGINQRVSLRKLVDAIRRWVAEGRSEHLAATLGRSFRKTYPSGTMPSQTSHPRAHGTRLRYVPAPDKPSWSFGAMHNAGYELPRIVLLGTRVNKAGAAQNPGPR